MASSFRVLNSFTGIPSHPLALFIVMLSKAHLTSLFQVSRGSKNKNVICTAWEGNATESNSFPLFHSSTAQQWCTACLLCTKPKPKQTQTCLLEMVSTHKHERKTATFQNGSKEKSAHTLFHTFLWRRKRHPLQCSCLESPTDREAWWAPVRGVAKSDTTEWPHTHTYSCIFKIFLSCSCIFVLLWKMVWKVTH